LAEFIQARGEIFCSETYKLINPILNSEEWKISVTVPLHKKGGKTDCSNYEEIPLLSAADTFIQHPSVKVNSSWFKII
jgi:hypothetical protein